MKHTFGEITRLRQKVAAARCFDTYHANLRTGVVLGSAYVDVGTRYGITPFVAAGVGVAFHQFTDLQDVSVQPAGGFGFADDKNQTNLAWAVMAGVGYTVNPRLKLELGYRYLNMGTIKGNQIVCQNVPGGCPLEQQQFKVSSHDFRLGMRWLFNDLPPPLIRKILNGQKQVLRNAGSGPRFCLGGRLS